MWNVLFWVAWLVLTWRVWRWQYHTPPADPDDDRRMIRHLHRTYPTDTDN